MLHIGIVHFVSLGLVVVALMLVLLSAVPNLCWFFEEAAHELRMLAPAPHPGERSFGFYVVAAQRWPVDFVLVRSWCVMVALSRCLSDFEKGMSRLVAKKAWLLEALDCSSAQNRVQTLARQKSHGYQNLRSDSADHSLALRSPSEECSCSHWAEWQNCLAPPRSARHCLRYLFFESLA